MSAGKSLGEPAVAIELGAEVVSDAFRDNSQHADEMSVLPTLQELATLRRVPNRTPARLFTIAFVELCERFSYYGSTVVCKCTPIYKVQDQIHYIRQQN
jgi:POT family proton-dependent oligopeptide transporter